MRFTFIHPIHGVQRFYMVVGGRGYPRWRLATVIGNTGDMGVDYLLEPIVPLLASLVRRRYYKSMA